MLNYLMTLAPFISKKKHTMSLLIFPEGTDLSPDNIKRSNSYARVNNLPLRKYVLHPKPLGNRISTAAFKPLQKSSSYCFGMQGSSLLLISAVKEMNLAATTEIRWSMT